MKWLTLTLPALLLMQSVHAESPVPVSDIAPLADVTLEAEKQIERLEKIVADEAAFKDKRDDDVRQAFGLLACLGQVIAEHKSKGDTEVNGPALRDAAMSYNRKGTFDEAKAALEAVKTAHAGKAEGDHKTDHPWNKLINMHPMMEEMNSRNGAILKVLRRPRGKAEEPMHATTWVVLALAMHADTHEVKNEADIPKWHAFSDEFRKSAIELGKAIRAKDKTEGRKWFDKANESCDACHEVFQE